MQRNDDWKESSEDSSMSCRTKAKINNFETLEHIPVEVTSDNMQNKQSPNQVLCRSDCDLMTSKHSSKATIIYLQINMANNDRRQPNNVMFVQGDDQQRTRAWIEVNKDQFNNLIDSEFEGQCFIFLFSVKMCHTFETGWSFLTVGQSSTDNSWSKSPSTHRCRFALFGIVQTPNLVKHWFRTVENTSDKLVWDDLSRRDNWDIQRSSHWSYRDVINTN